MSLEFEDKIYIGIDFGYDSGKIAWFDHSVNEIRIVHFNEYDEMKYIPLLGANWNTFHMKDFIGKRLNEIPVLSSGKFKKTICNYKK